MTQASKRLCRDCLELLTPRCLQRTGIEVYNIPGDAAESTFLLPYLPQSAGGDMSIRPVKRLSKAKPAIEGAGVHLRRAFGFGRTSDFDPFLLLDDFRNDIPEDYLAGFPWHPHRGIETITYVLAGTVEHGDSMGNRGAIAAGDVQWMTA